MSNTSVTFIKESIHFFVYNVSAISDTTKEKFCMFKYRGSYFFYIINLCNFSYSFFQKVPFISILRKKVFCTLWNFYHSFSP